MSFAWAQIPVEGDELPKLLGQQQLSAQVQALEAYIGGQYEPKGIKLHYNPDGKLVRVELFNGNNPWGEAIEQFQGKMPRGIMFTDMIVNVKKKFGEGRRIFLMSPLHHHYQKKGYHESKIVARFWIVSILLAIFSLVSLKLR
jgi:hypothetical protein